MSPPPPKCSLGRLFCGTPFRRLESLKSHRFPGVVRAPAFTPATLLLCMGMDSAKLAHSHRPRFQLITQPENPSAPLSRPFAPAAMLGLAPFALRVWAYANGRPLHSGPFSLRDKTSRPPRVPLFAPLPTPSRKTASFRFPLKDYASKLADLRSPVKVPLMNF